jgi:hypothetical protein
MDKGTLWGRIIDTVLEGFHWHRKGNIFVTNAKQVNAGSITVYEQADKVDIRVFGKMESLDVPNINVLNESVVEYNNTVKLVSNTISGLLDKGRTRAPKKSKEPTQTQLSLDI